MFVRIYEIVESAGRSVERARADLSTAYIRACGEIQRRRNPFFVIEFSYLKRISRKIVPLWRSLLAWRRIYRLFSIAYML